MSMENEHNNAEHSSKHSHHKTHFTQHKNKKESDSSDEVIEFINECDHRLQGVKVVEETLSTDVEYEGLEFFTSIQSISSTEVVTTGGTLSR